MNATLVKLGVSETSELIYSVLPGTIVVVQVTGPTTAIWQINTQIMSTSIVVPFERSLFYLLQSLGAQPMQPSPSLLSIPILKQHSILTFLIVSFSLHTSTDYLRIFRIFVVFPQYHCGCYRHRAWGSHSCCHRCLPPASKQAASKQCGSRAC